VPIEISDPTDPRLADYVSLTDVVLRRRHEPEKGLYIAESQKVIRRALRAGHRPRSYLMARRWLDDLADIVADAEADGVPVYFAERLWRAERAARSPFQVCMAASSTRFQWARHSPKD